MGLLDNILSGMQSPSGRLGLGLLAAAGPTAQPRSFGQRAMGLLAQMDADKAAEEERKQRAQMQALQQQLLQAQLGERQEAAGDRQRQRDQMATDERVLRNFFTPMDGPTPDGGPLMPRIDPATAIQQGASLPGVRNIMELNAALQPPKRQRKTQVVDGVLVEVPDEGPAVPLFSAPAKPEKAPTAVQEYEFARQQGYQGSFLDFQLVQRRASAPSTTTIVGTGKVGELETSYRKEFNSLPEVTRFKAAIPAYKAVEGAASRTGPQSDINLIYGLAKLYDPESVVREGEYDTIANSQSIPEWLKGQAQRLAGGGRLTPETKQQILTEARARRDAFQQMYESARGSYEEVIKRQGLDPRNVFINISAGASPGAPSGPLASPGNNTVTVNGRAYRFPTAEAAEQFRREVGQ